MIRTALLATTLCVALVLSVASSARAADGAWTSTADVYACLPTADGGVLLATGGGVARLEASAVRDVITALDGLPETRALALLEEGPVMWVGTERGLAEVRVEGGRMRVARVVATPPVRALVRHDGALYAATWGGGLVRFDARTLAPTRVGDGARATSLAVRDGALFVGTAGAGLFRVAGDARALVAVAPSLARASVWALASDGERLLVGAIDGLYAVRGDGGAKRLHAADVRSLAPSDGGFVAGTLGEGVLGVRGDGVTSAQRPIAGARFVTAVGARGEASCIASERGVDLRGANGVWHALPRVGLPSNDVSAIAYAHARLWIGTFDRGLVVHEGGKFASVDGVDSRVNALAIAGDRVFAGTARGLFLVEHDGDRTRAHRVDGLPSDDVHALATLSESRGGGVLVGTSRGTVVVRGDAVIAIDEKSSVAALSASAVAEGPDGALLIGTTSGLYVKAPRATAEWRRLSIASGDLDDDWVTAIATHADDVYVGTYNSGVVRVTLTSARAGARPGTRAVAERLGGGYVNAAGLVVTGGTLYAATMDGLLARPVAPGGAFRVLPGAAPGRDVTGAAVTPEGLVVASRRGLARAGSASVR